MNKTTLSAALLLLMTGSANAAIGEFALFDPNGSVYDVNDGAVGTTSSTADDVRDFGTGTWTLSKGTDLFAFSGWVAHDGTVYDTAGTYRFDAGDNCGAPNSKGCEYVVELLEGYTMGHIYFDWGSTTNANIINIWDANGNSVDIDGDGIAGWGMIDGVWVGFSANFTIAPGELGGTYAGAASVIPVPSAVWLFGSGLIGLIGVARRKGNA